MRDEDDEADDRGGDGGEKDAGGADVLGVAEAFAVLEGDFVGEEFEAGVEGLGSPDEADGEDEGEPLGAGNVEEFPGDEDGERGEEVDPRVGLGAQDGGDAAEGMAEAVGAFAEGHAARWRVGVRASRFSPRRLRFAGIAAEMGFAGA